MRLLAGNELWPLCLLCTGAVDEHRSTEISLPPKWTSLRLHLLHDDEPDLKEHLRQLMTLEVASKLAYGNVELSFSSFTDKPLPYLGYGNYGNFQIYSYTDYCFKTQLPLTPNLTLARDHLDQLNLLSPSPPPLSHPSAVFDALMRLLDSIDASDSAAGLPKPLDVVIITTNTWSHDPGDALRAIEKWNADRKYSSTSEEFSWGGFGSDLFDGVNLATAQDIKDWNALAQAFREADSQNHNPLVPLQLLEKFGPFPYPLVSSSHIGECNATEYPTWTVVRDQIQARDNLIVIFAVAEPLKSESLEATCAPFAATKGLTCLMHIYQKYMTQLDIRGSVIAIESPDSLSQTIADAVVETIAHLDLEAGSATHAAGQKRMRHKSQSAVKTSLAAASGALLTSFIGGVLIWQKCVDDEEDVYETEELPEQTDDIRAPLSRADKAVLVFRGFPIEDFSSFEPLESTPRTTTSSLPDHFF